LSTGATRRAYFLIDDESIYDKLNQPNFHLVIFATEANSFATLRDKIKRQYSGLMDFKVIAITPEVKELFGSNKDFSVLLRPDNHIGSIWSDISVDRVDEYLTEFIFHPK